MSLVLVDSSVWISFFKGSIPKEPFFSLIDTNQICTNDLILSEITPSLMFKKEQNLIEILQQVQKIPLRIDWLEIIAFQVKNLSKGINRVGIPDLIIVQNTIQNDLKLFSLDMHFKLMSRMFSLHLYE